MMPDAERPVRKALHTNAASDEGVGVRFIPKGEAMAKATGDGHYTTTDEATGRIHRFKVQKGDAIPDGAELVAGEAADEPVTEQAVDAEAKQAKAAKTGPSETTAATGPAEKA